MTVEIIMVAAIVKAHLPSMAYVPRAWHGLAHCPLQLPGDDYGYLHCTEGGFDRLAQSFPLGHSGVLLTTMLYPTWLRQVMGPFCSSLSRGRMDGCQWAVPCPPPPSFTSTHSSHSLYHLLFQVGRLLSGHIPLLAENSFYLRPF